MSEVFTHATQKKYTVCIYTAVKYKYNLNYEYTVFKRLDYFQPTVGLKRDEPNWVVNIPLLDQM